MIKFIVERASSLIIENLPCEEAVQESGYINEYLPNRSENVYTLEIIDLNQLVEFTKKYGRIIIVPTESDDNPWKDSGLPLLIIYDSYIE